MVFPSTPFVNAVTLGSAANLVLRVRHNPIVHGPFLHRADRVDKRPSRNGAVLMLGWGGSVPQQLQKYVDLYVGVHGMDVLVATTPLDAYIVGQPREHTAAVYRDLVELTQSLRDPTRGLHVHLFSNNGFILLLALQRYAKLYPGWCASEAIRSMVLDSTPLRRFPSPRFPSTLVTDVLRRSLPDICGTESYYQTLLATSLLRLQHKGSRAELGSIDECGVAPGLTMPRDKPVTILYGARDDLIPPKDVLSYADELERCQVEGKGSVRRVCFENGRHCALYKSDPALYEQEVAKILTDHYF
eukprot:PhM_4_TR3820/c0_g1_i1/m.61686